MRNLLTVVLLLSMAVLGGCAGHFRRERIPVTGEATVEQAIARLQAHSQTFRSTQINLMCKLSYWDEERKWRNLTGFKMKLWLEPPCNLYLVGNAVPGPEGKIFMGANQEEFWLSIRPEINTYWHGRWDDMPDVTRLELNPKVVLESLGLVEFAPHETWELDNQRGVDVITCTHVTSGRVTKRLFVDTRKYQLKRILYYDTMGEVAVVVDLERYRVLDGRNSVPTGIRVGRYLYGELDGRVTFTLTESRLIQVTEKARDRAFKRKPVASQSYDQIIKVTQFGSLQEKH